MKRYDKIISNYQLIPSTEIWSPATIDTYLNLLSFHYETGSFQCRQNVVFLADQLQQLIENMREWTEKGVKSPKETPFKFYAGETALENTFMLFKHQNQYKCMIKLFTINGLITYDEKFCQEMDIWLTSLTHQSTLISSGSAKVRFQFFDSQLGKIKRFIDQFT